MSAKYKSPRKPIPIRTEKAVLAKSRRRCTLCFGLRNDLKEKLGQIAHLDGNRSNNSESNLAWMCLDHHSLFDSKTKQHKNYTISEVKEYRRRLYKVLHQAPERSPRRARRPSASKPNQAERGAKVSNRGLEIVFGGDSKPYFENQQTIVLPGGGVYDRRYRVGVQNTTGAIVTARVVLENCEPSDHDGIHLGHALNVMSTLGVSETSVSPSDMPTQFFDVVYDETLEGKLRGNAFGLCYAAPVRQSAIPRGTYVLTLRAEGNGMQTRKKFKIFQDPTSQMLTMREINSENDRQTSAKAQTTDEDQSNWPDVILECQWPSLVHESRIPGTHIVRKRPWTLRYRGPGAVYNVWVHRVDLGEYEVLFLPSPVKTLTDTASVHPIICRKPDGEVIFAHDLESVIHDAPTGCDVQKYSVKTYGSGTEEIQFEDCLLEVEIPVTISYDDKNGNQFKIRYLLHYDTYMEKGEMTRIGAIEKLAPK